MTFKTFKLKHSPAFKNTFNVKNPFEIEGFLVEEVTQLSIMFAEALGMVRPV